MLCDNLKIIKKDSVSSKKKIWPSVNISLYIFFYLFLKNTTMLVTFKFSAKL